MSSSKGKAIRVVLVHALRGLVRHRDSQRPQGRRDPPWPTPRFLSRPWTESTPLCGPLPGELTQRPERPHNWKGFGTLAFPTSSLK